MMCELASSIPHTAIGWAWFWIFTFAKVTWFLPVVALVVWAFFELRNFKLRRDSNGCSWVFNKFVGGGFFLLFETAIDFLLVLAEGQTGHCVLLTNGFYLLPFILTGFFLHICHFWPYWKLPLIHQRIRLYYV
jgi:hypothetical protein